jgi:Na+-translocating ferredoxin:NAD+ oxidoreductase RnfC subunit
MRLASYGQTGESAEKAGQVFLCCECGLCEQACVMGLQPFRLNHELKGKLGPTVAREFKKSSPDKVNPFRELRRYPIPKLVQKLALGPFESHKAKLTDYPGKATKVKLLLKQHLGAPSLPLVQTGQEVAMGDLLAAPPEGATGAAIHASISGRVENIDDISITLTSD